jgi:hypothetical protein
MGLRPTRANENQRRHPRAGGGPCPEELDSRLRGNDMRAVIFRRATGDEESRTALNTLRARFLAPLGMTVWDGFSAAYSGAVIDVALDCSRPAAKMAELPSPRLRHYGETRRFDPGGVGSRGGIRRPTDSSADLPKFQPRFDVSRRGREVKSRTGTQNARTCALPALGQ